MYYSFIFSIFIKNLWYISRFCNMPSSYVYKTYTASGDLAAIRDRLIALFKATGYRLIEERQNEIALRYPAITFSSKKPLTCVSKLTISLQPESKNTISARFGMTFTKIKWFTILVIGSICGVLSPAISYWLHGSFDIPTPAYLGIPLGVMMHYHVRWRAFTALKRLLRQAESEAAK